MNHEDELNLRGLEKENAKGWVRKETLGVLWGFWLYEGYEMTAVNHNKKGLI